MLSRVNVPNVQAIFRVHQARLDKAVTSRPEWRAGARSAYLVWIARVDGAVLPMPEDWHIEEVVSPVLHWQRLVDVVPGGAAVDGIYGTFIECTARSDRELTGDTATRGVTGSALLQCTHRRCG